MPHKEHMRRVSRTKHTFTKITKNKEKPKSYKEICARIENEYKKTSSTNK